MELLQHLALQLHSRVNEIWEGLGRVTLENSHLKLATAIAVGYALSTIVYSFGGKASDLNDLLKTSSKIEAKLDALDGNLIDFRVEFERYKVQEDDLAQRVKELEDRKRR